MSAQDTAVMGKNAGDGPAVKPPTEQRKPSASERIGVGQRRR